MSAPPAPARIASFAPVARADARVLINGTHAWQCCRPHSGPLLAREHPALVLLRLPSTSPATASWSYARKLAAWSAALGPQAGSMP